MNQYLRSIGFSKCRNQKDVQKILQYLYKEPTKTAIINEGEDIYGYVSRSFGKNMGIRMVGFYGEDHHYQEEYYFPYVESEVVSSRLPMSTERHSDRLAFGGVIEDPGMGISLIFYLNNGIDVMGRRQKNEKDVPTAVSMNALSTSGKILLPLHKTETERAKMSIRSKQRNNLIEKASKGDEEAMEDLAMKEMAIMQNVSKRLEKEDIYSLVDTSFMPYGLESDQYAILGEILKVDELVNRVTGEECWQLTVECNQLKMTVTLNKMDLLGEPAVGRRFKGEVWLQGTALYENEM